MEQMEEIMKRLVCMVGAVLMATADSAAALNPEKIAEIAATLPETPRADGAPFVTALCIFDTLRGGSAARHVR